MIGAASAAGPGTATGPFVVGALTLLALLLFAGATRWGRWWAWLAGYLAVLLAIGAALFFRAPDRPEPSTANGVVFYVAQATPGGTA